MPFFFKKSEKHAYDFYGHLTMVEITTKWTTSRLLNFIYSCFVPIWAKHQRQR